MIFSGLVGIVVLTVVYFRGRRLSLLHLVLAQLLPSVVGAYLMMNSGRVSPRPLLLMISALVAFALAYNAGDRICSGRPTPSFNLASSSIFPLTRWVVYAGVVVHFVRGGVPILSGNVELTRLNFSASGLLGIPGRAYLFGLPLVLALTAWEARSQRKPLWRYGAFRMCFVVFALSRMVSGFKSAILEVLLVLALLLVTSKAAPSFWKAARSFSMPLVVALLAAYLIGTNYATYAAFSGGSQQAFVGRLTNGAAESTVVVLNDEIPRHDTGAAVITDFKYYASSYFHVGPGSPYAFEKVVAGAIVKTAPTNPYLAPVTTGAFADVYFDGGPWLALAVMAMLGVLSAWLVDVARRSESHPLRYLWAFAGTMAMFSYLSKGSIAYSLINLTAVAGLVTVIAKLEILMRSHVLPLLSNQDVKVLRRI